MTYDLDYRLTGLATTDGVTPVQGLAYTYGDVNGDAGNIRAIADALARDQVFDYDALYRLTEADGSGATAREYIHIDGLPLGMVVGTTLYFVHPDHLGAPQKITDGAKTIVWDGQFTPFGQVHSITGALVANWRLPGQYHDAEAQLSYNYRRTYDPTLAITTKPRRNAGVWTFWLRG